MSDDVTADDSVKLEGPLTLETVGAARTVLLAALAQAGDLRCDLGAVDPCDTAGVQLLCAAVATAAQSHRSLTVVAASAAVRAAAARVGVRESAIGLSSTTATSP